MTPEQQELVDRYKALGVTIRTSVLHPQIDEVKIEMPDSLWMDFMDIEGENLGLCCGTISRIRSAIVDAAINSRFMKVQDLYNMLQNIKKHDHSSPEQFQYFLDLWEKIKEDVEVDAYGHPADPQNPWHCAEIIASCQVLGLEKIFRGRYKDHSVNSEFRYSASIGMEIASIYPALKTLVEKIKTLDVPTVEGFAVCSGDLVAKESSGFGIFPDKKLADEIADDCNAAERRLFESSTPPKRKRYHYVTRPVRISLGKGLEFTDIPRVTS